MRKNLFKIKSLGALLFLTVFLFNNASSSSAANSFSSNEASWTFDATSDFSSSDIAKLQFSDGSAKIIPDNFTSDWSKIWHDAHFAPNVGNSNAYSMSIDSEGNMYIGGETDNGNGGANLGYIVKLDKDFNEIWYKNDYFAGQTASEMYRSIIDDQDNFLVHGGYTDATLRSHSVLMKVSLGDGSVIWSEDIIQPAGVILLSGWDRSAGPVVDSNHNIYIAISNNTGENTGANSEPTGIYKFDQNGNLIWNVSDLLATHVATYHYVDLWDMVVDSEGSVYLGISGNPPWPSGIQWGILKYDTDGNYQWNNLKLWAGMGQFQQGRGIAIDSEDNIYQDGNAGDGPPGANCGIRKLDKDGNVIFEQITTDIDYGNYCWGSTVNQFDEWIVPGEYSPDTAGSYIKKYGTDMTKIGQVTDEESPRLVDGHRAIKSAFDKYGNAYALTYLKDTNYSDKYSVLIIKTKNTYPDTTPGTGTPLTLINKTPVSYNILNGFSVEYGPMDQADVKFQISNDGVNWYYFNGSSWVETAGYDSNTTAEVNINISKFSDQFGPGQFYFKSFMIADGTKEVDLKSVTITKDLPLGVLPVTGKDGDDHTPTIISSILFFVLITSALVKRSDIKI